MKQNLLLTLSIVLTFSGCTHPASLLRRHEFKTLTDYVDPFIGTGGHGHTFPGATLPFGMVQLSPDTRLEGWDGCGGYHYFDSIIYGFTHTHLSGTGIPDYADILFMPTTGIPVLDNGTNTGFKKGYASYFSHRNEEARPGYYKVKLDDDTILAELTATNRVGFHRYTFPKTDEANIIVDLVHRDKVLDSWIKVTGNNEIEGFRRSSSWASDQRLYFVARFSRPFKSFGLASGDTIQQGKAEVHGRHIKAFFRFTSGGNDPVLVKVALSAVSQEGARKNLEAELPGWNFDFTAKQADSTWEKELGKIQVEGGTNEQKVTFYTALYHAFIQPNLYMDVDSNYLGRDFKIHKASDFANYTVFSLWDTYRAAHPLYTLVQQRRTADFINTFLVQYQQGGSLPMWELSANETWCMIGYHSIPVIVDAYEKKLVHTDSSELLQAMLASANNDRLGLKYYREKGYIPADMEGESVSKTLEYAFDDWCIANYARLTRKKDVASEFMQRAQYYKNVFDPSTGFMRAKRNETWYTPFDPREVNSNYTEANAWQYSFYVPQDINTLIDLIGGRNSFEARLDSLFTITSKTTGRNQSDITGMIGQYAHGNEPSHHVSYLYNYVGKPWKTQQMVRKIMDELYTPTPEGLCGNDDCGQMSAWYIMSALGFYPVQPGSGIYVIGSPLFARITIRLENGNTFVIKADQNSSTNNYIRSAILNGNPWNKSWISHADIAKGGEIEFVMGPQPGQQWGTEPGDCPQSRITENLIEPVPYMTGSGKSFTGKTEIKLRDLDSSACIHFTLNGKTPGAKSPVYKNPLPLSKNTILKAVSINKNGTASKTVSAEFFMAPQGRTIRLLSGYSPQYAAGGDNALIDCLRGSDSYQCGDWQGFEGDDVHAIVDLSKETLIKHVSLSCLQSMEKWIFFPVEVSFSISTDGTHFTPAGQATSGIKPSQPGTVMKEIGVPVNRKARYIEVAAKNMGVCPSWHPGAGSKAWIFADEVLIK